MDNRLHMNLNSSLSSSPIVIYNDGSSEQFTVPIYERYLVIRRRFFIFTKSTKKFLVNIKIIC